MTALVTKHLPLVAGAPGGLSQIRMLLLRLAIQGRLVPQCAEEGTGQDVLDEVERERNSCGFPSTKIPKVRPGAVSNNDEAWLPSNWVNARVGDVVLTIKSGGTPNKSNPEFWGGEIPWASVKDLNVARDLVSTQDFITDAGLAEGSKLAAPGDLLICTRMGLGKIAVAKVAVAFNQDLKGVRLARAVDVDYFINYYRTLSIQGSGMTVAGIKQDELLNFSLPLPPLAEQHRIVAKVDELMALCDRLEADQTDAEAAHAHLVQALLDSLTQATDAADFRASWQRLSEHFHTLFTTEANIDALKQAIRELAIRGALIRGVETIVDIHAAPEKEPRPFGIPPGWRWVKLDNLVLDLRYGTSTKCSYECAGTPVLRIPNIGEKMVTLDDLKYGELSEDEKRSYALKDGDILMIRSNGSASLVGRTAIVGTEAAKCAFAGYLVRIRLPRDRVNPEYFHLALGACHVRSSIEAPIRTTSGVKNINSTEIRGLQIPLPPLAEQHRIVAKVDELTALCDQLKAQLAKGRQQHAQLATVLVEQAVA